MLKNEAIVYTVYTDSIYIFWENPDLILYIENRNEYFIEKIITIFIFSTIQHNIIMTKS